MKDLFVGREVYDVYFWSNLRRTFNSVDLKHLTYSFFEVPEFSPIFLKKGLAESVPCKVLIIP